MPEPPDPANIPRPVEQGRVVYLKLAYPVECVCKLLGASRGAYNKWASGKLSLRTAEIKKINADSPDKGYQAHQ